MGCCERAPGVEEGLMLVWVCRTRMVRALDTGRGSGRCMSRCAVRVAPHLCGSMVKAVLIAMTAR